MGEKSVEDAKRNYGEMVVENVLFTDPNKLILATQGKQTFQDSKMRIPAGNNALRTDWHKLKKITGATGRPRFVADSNSDGHADRTWAVFLAINVASQNVYEIEYQSLGTHSSYRLLNEYSSGSELETTNTGFCTVSDGNDFGGFI